MSDPPAIDAEEVDPVSRGCKLRCPYCGASIAVELMDAAPTSYYQDMVVDYIVCDYFKCSATWDRNGDVRSLPDMLLYTNGGGAS